MDKQMLSSYRQLKGIASAATTENAWLLFGAISLLMVRTRSYCFVFFVFLLLWQQGQIYKNLKSEFIKKFAIWVNDCCSNHAEIYGMRNAQLFVLLLFQLHWLCSGHWTLQHCWLHKVCVGLDIEFCFVILTTTHKQDVKMCSKFVELFFALFSVFACWCFA